MIKCKMFVCLILYVFAVFVVLYVQYVQCESEKDKRTNYNIRCISILNRRASRVYSEWTNWTKRLKENAETLKNPYTSLKA